MAAKLNNAPAYVVYDRTFNWECTTSIINTCTNPVNTITGTYDLMRDKDLATLYGISSVGSSGVAGWQIYYTVTCDFKKIIWNCQVSTKYYLWLQSPAFQTCSVSVSQDGITWVTIDNTPNVTMEWSFPVFSMRYLRYNVSTSSSFGDIALNIYEVKVFGSD